MIRADQRNWSASHTSSPLQNKYMYTPEFAKCFEMLTLEFEDAALKMPSQIKSKSTDRKVQQNIPDLHTLKNKIAQLKIKQEKASRQIEEEQQKMKHAINELDQHWFVSKEIEKNNEDLTIFFQNINGLIYKKQYNQYNAKDFKKNVSILQGISFKDLVYRFNLDDELKRHIGKYLNFDLYERLSIRYSKTNLNPLLTWYRHLMSNYDHRKKIHSWQKQIDEARLDLQKSELLKEELQIRKKLGCSKGLEKCTNYLQNISSRMKTISKKIQQMANIK